MQEKEGRPDSIERGIRIRRVVSSGALGTSVVAVTQLAQKNSLNDGPLILAVYLFAVSIPILAASVALYTARLEMYPDWPSNLRHSCLLALVIVFVEWAALLMVFLGVACLFWHLSWPAGIIFLTMSIPAYFSVMYLSGGRVMQA
jgi:hypothetical protein